jgi:predicted DNA-binding WGR domain protein
MDIISKRPVYWECKIDGHNKFWAANIVPELVGETSNQQKKYILVRRWGSIGTSGQKMEQIFHDVYEAERSLDKLIWDKENKGYKAIF